MHKFLQQNINQWLCMALIGLMCFWVVLYYLGHKAQDLGESMIVNASELSD